MYTTRIAELQKFISTWVLALYAAHVMFFTEFSRQLVGKIPTIGLVLAKLVSGIDMLFSFYVYTALSFVFSVSRIPKFVLGFLIFTIAMHFELYKLLLLLEFFPLTN